jgi:hypothetical protein
LNVHVGAAGAQVLLVWVTVPGAQQAGAATLVQPWLVVMVPV